MIKKCNNKGKNNSFYGKKHSKESRKRMSKSAIERFKNKENHPHYGKLNTKEFIKKAKRKHNEFYSYQNAVYTNAKAKIKIQCPIHGAFEQIVNNHLRGAGCPACGRMNTMKNRTGKFKKITTAQFIERSNKMHNFFYSYAKTIYKNSKSGVTIECPIHGEFVQEAHVHLKGHGCPKCPTVSWDLLGFYKTDLRGQELGHLYQLKIYNEKEVFWKIGITCNTIKRRYGNKINNYNYIIVDDFILKNLDAAKIEDKIHNDNKYLKYTPKDISWGGFNECYKKQINIAASSNN